MPSGSEAVFLPGRAMVDLVRAVAVRIYGTQVEVLGVGPIGHGDLDEMPSNDALFVAAHSWALDTATLLTVVAGDDTSIQATAPFASAAGLLAMKLHAVEDRRSAGLDKRAGDAWDIYRLLLDLDVDSSIRTALTAAPRDLRLLVRAAAERVLVTDATRTQGWLRAGDEAMATITAVDLRYVGQPLVEALG